jgi:hypothetical protein
MMIHRNALPLLAMGMMMSLISISLAEDDDKTKADPSGTWRWEHEENGETIKDILRLSVDDDGKVTGTYEGRIGPIKLDEAELEGDELSCEFEIEFNDNTIEVEFEGKIDGDEVTGTVEISGGDQAQEFPWVATRSVEDSDIVGTWDVEIELNDGGTLMPTLTIEAGDDGLGGSYTSTLSNVEMTLSDLAVADNKLTFTVSAELDGNSLTADFEVAPRGDKFNGTVAYDYNGQTGDLDVEADRRVEKDDDGDDDDAEEDDDDGDDDK